MSSQNTTFLPATGTLAKANRPSHGVDYPASRAGFVINLVILLLPLAYLWLRLINNLRIEWSTNPQYSYGLVVPLLCIGLLARRWHGYSALTFPTTSRYAFAVWLFAALAFLYLPTRLVEAATPEWRPIQWSLGIETIGLTFCSIFLARGRGWLRQLAFPICFFFVAIPWPTIVEQPIIQSLTRVSASVVIEMLGAIGVPAMAHGNLIEISSGMVGIDEACSGIRSFQSSFMISLFLGEFYSLGKMRRWLLVPIGLLLSFALNIGRMFLLTLVAARKGVAAIHEYHDPAGITIAIGCTLGLWGLAVWWKSCELKKETESLEIAGSGSPIVVSEPSVVHKNSQTLLGKTNIERSTVLFRLSLLLIVWLLLVESGVQLWYRHLESNLKTGSAWTLNFPKDKTDFVTLPIPPETEYLLRFDEGKQAGWTESDGTHWQVFYFGWDPGKVAGYLAKRHTPEICMQGVGYKMVSGPELTMMNVKGVELPVRSYIFETGNGPLYVFHCRWEAGVKSDAYVTHESGRFNLIRGVWAGRGDKGQKVVEVIVSGYSNMEQAKAAVSQQLEKIIVVEKPAAKG